MRGGTGAQAWALTTGNNNAPTLTQGEQTSFFCNTVPDRCPTGNLAYVLPYVLLTIIGTVIQPESGGSKLWFDDLTGALIRSVNWITAWHGTPVSSNHVLGSNLPIVEFINGGFRYALRRRPAIPSGTGSYPFRLSVAIPASACRYGDLMLNTAQLAKLYQQSEIQINIAAPSVLDGLSDGATFGTLTARCSAILYPTSELVLGTPVENILHQTVAGSNSNEVQIKGFGTSTLLNGVEKKGGVMFLGELTGQGLQGGVFEAEDVTQVSFPWRGQNQINHMEALISPFMQAQGNSRPQTQPTIITDGDGEFAGYPYSMNNSDQATTSVEAGPMDLNGLRVFPFVYSDDDVQLCDLQTADHDESYYLTLSGSFDEGTHLFLAQYARAWEKTMRDAWVELVTGGKNSLADYVLQGRAAGAKLGRRIPTGRYIVTSDQETYLPWQLA
jgi:hypothetical protein